MPEVVNEPQVISDAVSVYWVPGCALCTRVKGYLQGRGIVFTSINVLEDLVAVDDMKSAGIVSVPWVRKGDQWAPGQNLDRVDELIGLTTDPKSRVLPIEELVERSTQFLETASRLALQLPSDHYDDPTPTGENVKEAFVFMADGTPFIQHSTFKGLVHHIASHGEKFKRIALSADGVHELGYSLRRPTGDDIAFGEPSVGTPMYRVVAQMELAAKDIRAWLQVGQLDGLSRTVERDWGIQTIHQLLQTHTCSFAQHTRQLAEIVSRFGIKTDGVIREKDLEGLLMPAGVWS